MRNESNSIVVVGCTWSGMKKIVDLHERGLRFSRIVTIDERTAEANRVSGYCDFRKFAREAGVELYEAVQYNLQAEEDVAFFREHQFDLLITAGWQRLIPEEVLRTLRIGGLGGHGSADFLPIGRGRSPLTWSLIEGKQRFILHLFLMAAGADNGEIIDWMDFDINEWDDIETLYYKSAIAMREMTLQAVPRLLAGTATTRPQEGDASYYAKRTPADGEIDWSSSVFALHNFIRAQTKPYPGAYTFLNGQKCTLWAAQPFDTRLAYFGKQYGEIVEVFDCGFVVHCRSGTLLVTDWECAGCVPEPGRVLMNE